MSEWWAEELLRIQNNDMTHLHLCLMDIPDVDPEEAGRAIMENNSIVSLEITDFRKLNVAKYQPLILGISQNKSIQSIGLHTMTIREDISKLFLCENLSSLFFRECNIFVADVLETLYCKNNLPSLQNISISDCIFNLDNRAIKGAKIQSCNKQIKLKSLEFSGNRFDDGGYEGLARLLQNSSETLETLEIQNLNNPKRHLSFFDEIKAFFNEIKECKSLEVLEYTNCRDQEDLIQLASVLSNLPLRHLGLSNSDIGTDAAMAISDGISQNRTLETLDLQCIDTSDDIFMLMIPGILGPASTIKHLHFECGYALTDASILSLADALVNNCTLEKFVLRETYSVTIFGWRAFSRVLGSSRSVLRELQLSDSAIDDDIITAFAYELSRNPDSKLKCLGISARDREDLSITNVGWSAILNLLCNRSNIDATWSSNHTLYDIGDISVEGSDQDSDDSDTDEDEVKMPAKLYDLLEMNKLADKKQVARMKVIEHHFSEGFDASVLAGDGQKLLPRTISWFGRDSLGYPAVYNIIRTMPELCETDQQVWPRDFKRKKLNNDNNK